MTGTMGVPGLASWCHRARSAQIVARSLFSGPKGDHARGHAGFAPAEPVARRCCRSALRLGTHPDIIERLWDLDAQPCRWVFWAKPSLVHPQTGVVFAVGFGTTALSCACRLMCSQPPRLVRHHSWSPAIRDSISASRRQPGMALRGVAGASSAMVQGRLCVCR